MEMFDLLAKASDMELSEQSTPHPLITALTQVVCWPSVSVQESLGDTINYERWTQQGTGEALWTTTIHSSASEHTSSTPSQARNSSDIHPIDLSQKLPQPSSASLPNFRFLRKGLSLTDTRVGEEFEILHTLGEGGMGVVQEAVQRGLQRRVAIKRQKIHSQNNDISRALLLKEAQITGSLEHPNIVPVHTLGCDEEGALSLVMKRVDGESWQTLLHEPKHPFWYRKLQEGGEPLEYHLEILTELCNALSFAHSQGIVHRDIKPANVMIGAFGEVCLLDWGIATELLEESKAMNVLSPEAQQTKGQALVGTLAYIAPEMLLGDIKYIDERTDVYLLGATLYEILIGRPPHRGQNMQDILFSIFLEEKSFPTTIPTGLVEICLRALSIDPAQRFPNAQALRFALKEFLRRREANKICEQAWLLLEELDKAISKEQAETSENLGGSTRDVVRLFTECRFGFSLALRDWSENTRAKAGLERCLHRMIERALERQDARQAQDLLEELSSPVEDLQEKLARLQQQIALEKEEQEKLRYLSEDLDFYHSPRAKMWFFMSMATLSTIVSVAVSFSYYTKGTLPSHRDSIVALVVFSICSLFIFGVRRKKLLTNAASRQFVASMVIGTSCLLGYRIFSMWAQIPIDKSVHGEFFLFATLFGLPAIFAAKWLLWPTLICLVSGFVCMFWPSLLVPLQGISLSVIWYGGSVVFFREWSLRRAKERLQEAKGGRS